MDNLVCPVTIPSPVSLAPQAPAVGQILIERQVTIPRQIPRLENQGGATPDNTESAKPESPSASVRLTEIFSLEWWRYFTLRRAGTYQYTYRPAERAGSVALVSLSATEWIRRRKR